MKATITCGEKLCTVDFSKPIDISIPLQASKENPIAWYLDAPKMEPVQMGNYVGKVSEGASVNFNNIYFNPHAHGTHTECLGHITEKFHSVNETLKTFFFGAKLITVVPEKVGEDEVIPKKEIEKLVNGDQPEALVIRTLPNTSEKKSKKYSHTNWPYLHEEAAKFIAEIGVMHLLIDLPSVDKEKDEGELVSHKAFWNINHAPRLDATITEMIYVPNNVKDGDYLLNLQMASFENDASPSKPVLYKFLNE